MVKDKEIFHRSTNKIIKTTCRTFSSQVKEHTQIKSRSRQLKTQQLSEKKQVTVVHMASETTFSLMVPRQKIKTKRQVKSDKLQTCRK